jgi:hypothetical protein
MYYSATGTGLDAAYKITVCGISSPCGVAAGGVTAAATAR